MSTNHVIVADILDYISHPKSTSDIAFAPVLASVSFDYTPVSIQRLSDLLSHLGKKFSLPQLLTTPNIDKFLLIIAVYLGNYLALCTKQPIVWLNYDDAQLAVAEKNRQFGTKATLIEKFDNSILAQIGENTFFQPLRAIDMHMQGESSLEAFITSMQATIFKNQKVVTAQDANQVCDDYLSKITSKKLIDSNFAFFEELSQFDFDYSEASLVRLDELLVTIKNTHQLTAEKFASLSKQTSYQKTILLLGFYVGMTCAQLNQSYVRWITHAQAMKLLTHRFEQTLSNQFFMLLPKQDYLPIHVVCQALFYPNASSNALMTFFGQLQSNDTANFSQVSYALPMLPLTKKLPQAWQTALQMAGKWLAETLFKLSQNTVFMSQVLVFDNARNIISKQPLDQATANPEQLSQAIYAMMDENLAHASYAIALYQTHLNLPQGQFDGLVVVVRTYQQPALAFEVMIPFRPLTHASGFGFFPMLFDHEKNQAKLINQPKLLQTLVTAIVASLQVENQAKQRNAFFKQYFHATLDRQAVHDTLSIANIKAHSSAHIPLPLLALKPKHAQLPSMLAKNANDRIEFKAVFSRLQPHQYDYLQVLVPKWLMQDILFSQIKAMPTLYHQGHIVWGAVIWANYAMFYPKEEHCAGEVVYDPNGKTPLPQLQYYAKKLFALKGTSPVENDQLFYANHLTSETSRIFDLPYPKSLADVPLRVSSVWFWRYHLPNGMLSDEVLPLIISPNAKGRVMPLPARFWEKGFYQSWLDKARAQFDVADGYDLLPGLEKDEQRGSRFMGQGLDPYIFPKFHQLLPRQLNAVVPDLAKHPTPFRPVLNVAPSGSHKNFAYNQFEHYHIQ